MENVYIGVDVGGMSIKVGAVKDNGEIIFRNNSVTDSSKVDLFLEDIDKTIEKVVVEVKDKYEIKGIGIGIPGLVDNDEGTILKMANIQGQKVKLRDKLLHYNLPIYLSNDANVATLAEQRFGVAKGYNDVILITLGTGVGGGIVINGKLYEGHKGKGAELGHVMLKYGGRQCGCGRKGCLEAYASASALLNLTREYLTASKNTMMWDYVEHDMNKISGRTSFECAKKGDPYANKLIDEYITYLGEGLIDFCNIFRPEVIVIGGGISNQGDYLKDKLQNYLEKEHYGYIGAPRTEVMIAKLKNDAGIVGAASLFME